MTRGFQSTHPLRGATKDWQGKVYYQSISIHAPLAGCDKKAASWARTECYFNPRTPCGVRPYGDISDPQTIEFQSTHPLRGATGAAGKIKNDSMISIHAPLAGCDQEMEGKKDG